MIVINKRVTNIPHQIIILEEINVIKLYKKFILNPMFVINFLFLLEATRISTTTKWITNTEDYSGHYCWEDPFCKIPCHIVATSLFPLSLATSESRVSLLLRLVPTTDLSAKYILGKKMVKYKQILVREQLRALWSHFLTKVTLYTEIYSTSPLYEDLEEQGTLACGTARSNRKGLPRDITDAQNKEIKSSKLG